MCQKPTVQQDENSKRKVYVVLFTLDRDAKTFGVENSMNYMPMKIFASHLMAKTHCENQANEWARAAKISSDKILWLNEDRLVCDIGDCFNACSWEIYETDIDDDVPYDFHYPAIESENEVLRKECYRLRKELADVTQRNAVAATYATIWDGGLNYTKERVLEVLHIVKDVLAGDHKKVTELFENWLRNREAK